EIHTGIDALNSTVNPIISETLSLQREEGPSPVERICHIASVVWGAGVVLMLAYGVYSYVRVRIKVREAVPEGDRIYVCEGMESPFILGIVRPRIFLPVSLSGEAREYVLVHERAHLARLDHLWKPFGFLLLSLHWFNPLMWLSYILLSRDIEAACDEKVIKRLGEDAKAPYATALIDSASARRLISACPLAFGETGVRGRVRSVLSYKKPAFWIILVSLLLCTAVAVLFLTDPKDPDVPKQESVSQLQGLTLEIKKIEISQPDPYITVLWKNDSGEDIVYGEDFYIFSKVNGAWENMRIEENYVWNSIGHYLTPGQQAEKRYYLNGIIMTEAGKYRFETDCFIEGAPDEKYKATVEFELEQGIAPIGVHTLDPIELVYDAPMFSFVQTPDNAPEYMLVNGMTLLKSENGVISSCGTLEERDIRGAGFEGLFQGGDIGWNGGLSAPKLMEKNMRFWELDGNGDYSYYVLLRQEDGRYYLGEGYISEGQRFVRWLYKMSEIGRDEGGSVTQLCEENSIYFYDKSYAEGVSFEIDSYYSMSDGEAQTLYDALENEKWVYDALVDRLEFEYDGMILCEGRWLCFGLEDGVFYYDEYFCEGAKEAAGLVEELLKKSVKYAPISKPVGDSISAGGEIYVYPDSPDLMSPNLNLSDDGTFTFTLSALSSAHITGTYEKIDGLLILTTDAEVPDTYVFEIKDYFTITFDAERSAKIPEYRYSSDGEPQSPVPDGACFVRTLFLGDASFSFPVYDSVECDINGDGSPEKCTLSPGPTSGVISLALHVVDMKSGKEYRDWWGWDIANARFVVEEENLYICGERRLSMVDYVSEYETVCMRVSLEGGDLTVEEAKSSSFVGGFLRVYRFEEKSEEPTREETDSVCERMYEKLGRTDPDTGLDYYCVVHSSFEINGEKYYFINWKWLVPDDEGNPSHASQITQLVLSEDFSKLYDAYFEDDGILKICNKRNLMN
ncbi:MAG: M56 family metallopeptidase, partial [Clostridia bacterium]|nr:M56 family metallopeptidase [Clostridia bacterium]